MRDPELDDKAKEQRNLPLSIANCSDNQLKINLKKKRKQLQHEIRHLAL